jgi:type II secretory pathway predicted ATPase ExeA
MVLLAATTGQTEIDEAIVTAVVALLRYQLDVRRELDPVDAENTIAVLEEKIRRSLARRAVKKRDLQRKVSYQRYGVWAWKAAVTNLLAAGELHHDKRADTYALP